MSREKSVKRPYGFAPRDIDGITMRKTEEVPEGVQALYYKGTLVKVCRIGEPQLDVRCDAVTLNPKDYEVVLKCYFERTQRERSRRFRGPIVKTPTQTEIERVFRQRGLNVNVGK